MPENDKSILKHSHGEKFLFIIYADIEPLLEKIDACQNNPEKSSTTKINNIQLLVIHYLHIVHFITQKINMIIIEAKIV